MFTSISEIYFYTFFYSCNCSRCHCVHDFFPVCDKSTGLNYKSPCLAGCQGTEPNNSKVCIRSEMYFYHPYAVSDMLMSLLQSLLATMKPQRSATTIPSATVQPQKALSFITPNDQGTFLWFRSHGHGRKRKWTQFYMQYVLCFEIYHLSLMAPWRNLGLKSKDNFITDPMYSD